MPEEKKCPFCAEMIKAEAIICRFCGKDQPKQKKTAEQIKKEYEEQVREILTPDIDKERSAKIECKKCGAEYFSEYDKKNVKKFPCPRCGSENKRKNTLEENIHLCCVIFIFLVLAFMCVRIVGCLAQGVGKKSETMWKIEAHVACQEFVKKRLKSPSTAEFQSFSEDRVSAIGDNVYIVRGYVDAQNSFGATIRNNYVCKVRGLTDDNWQLEQLDLR